MSDWQSKLRRMGVTKGARNIKVPPIKPRPEMPAFPPTNQPTNEPENTDDPVPLQQLLPGLHPQENEYGVCWVRDKVFAGAYVHGELRLDSVGGEMPAFTTNHQPNLNLRDCLFLDTETTGLAGANAFAFMVGAGFFDDDVFIVRQYFVPDPADEGAMLTLLAELAESKAGLVTFNGRTFDVPLLDNRYLMNRLGAWMGVLPDMPHLDLLHPARRIWRRRLESCSLISLEQNLLNIPRTHADVPGWAIPQLYYDYLRHQDGRDMARVFYHNEIDILSMVTLTTELMRQFNDPQPTDPALDLLSLGRWLAHLGDTEHAEAVYRMALAGDAPLDQYQRGLAELALLFKRADRRPEAVVLWQQIAVITFEDVTAHVELAKYYEWHAVDLTIAQRWTEQALTMAQNEMIRAELAHRLARLLRKQTGGVE